MRHQMEVMARPFAAPAPDAPFPFFDSLAQAVNQLGADTRLLLVFPPVHISALPVPGSPAEARLRACKARAQHIVSTRPRSGLFDLLVDGPLARDINRFIDRTHYNDATAREIEPMIGAAARERYGPNVAEPSGQTH
jgi:hypothetical protein